MKIILYLLYYMILHLLYYILLYYKTLYSEYSMTGIKLSLHFIKLYLIILYSIW